VPLAIGRLDQPCVLAKPLRRRPEHPAAHDSPGQHAAPDRRRPAARLPFPASDGRLEQSDHARSQPHAPRFSRGRAPEGRRRSRIGAVRADGDRRAARAAVPRDQQGARRGRDAAAGRTGRQRPSHALSAVGSRRGGAADCVRQHRHAAPGAGLGAHARDGGPHGARGRPRPHRPANDCREPAVGARRRRIRPAPGGLGRARIDRIHSRRRRAACRHRHRRRRPPVHAGRDGGDEPAVRPDPRAPRVQGRPDRRDQAGRRGSRVRRPHGPHARTAGRFRDRARRRAAGRRRPAGQEPAGPAPRRAGL